MLEISLPKLNPLRPINSGVPMLDFLVSLAKPEFPTPCLFHVHFHRLPLQSLDFWDGIWATFNLAHLSQNASHLRLFI